MRVRCVGDFSDLENNLINLDQRSEPDSLAQFSPGISFQVFPISEFGNSGF